MSPHHCVSMSWWQSGNLHRISISAPVWMHPVAIWAGLMIINNLLRLRRELGSWIAGFYVVLQVSIQFIRIFKMVSWVEGGAIVNIFFWIIFKCWILSPLSWVEHLHELFFTFILHWIPRDYCKYRESLSEKNISFALINTSSSDPGINAFCSN